jgi:hypothetical protein
MGMANLALRFALSTLPLLASMAVGCNRDRASVVGTVTTHNGQPLDGARITVRSNETGNWATAVTDSQGRFRLGTVSPGDGIPAGEYYATLIEERGDWDHPTAPRIHAKYGKPEDSGLRLKVEAGEKLTFDLVLDGPDVKDS